MTEKIVTEEIVTEEIAQLTYKFASLIGCKRGKLSIHFDSEHGKSTMYLDQKEKRNNVTITTSERIH